MVSQGIDLFLALDDQWAHRGVHDLAAAGVPAGETGAAGIGGLIALLTGTEQESWRRTIDIGADSRVLVICTEAGTA